METLAWNVRGLGTATKGRDLSILISQANISVFFMLNTKLITVNSAFIRRMWNISSVNWTCVDSDGKSGGLLCLWDSDKFRVESVEISSNWIAIKAVIVNR